MQTDAMMKKDGGYREPSPEQWQGLVDKYKNEARHVVDRILVHLQLLRGEPDAEFDRFKHSLQTATLAHQAGENEEYVVCALLHDIGDTLSPYNHPEVAAAILKPYVSEENHWMVEHHGIFQGYYFFHHVGLDRNLREQFRGHPCFERTARFCEKYDTVGFDPYMENMPLAAFEPMLRRVFATAKNTIYKW
jgi:predicted HD phosphohydrolase